MKKDKYNYNTRILIHDVRHLIGVSGKENIRNRKHEKETEEFPWT